MTPPLLSIKEIVDPGDWMNIPICLVKGIEHILENSMNMESMIFYAHKKIQALVF